ncbi:MAG: hypothetical protein AAF281_16220 [Pseudomonadota bacterium]
MPVSPSAARAKNAPAIHLTGIGCALSLLLLPPALAAQIVPPAEFEALSAGKTLTFERNGVFYGAEQYGTRRDSLWQYSDTQCVEGIWFPAGDQLCFLYDGQTQAQCWLFERRGNDLFARLGGTPPEDTSEIRLSEISEEPLACPAPDLGV